ncbi:TIGR03564 family F420-dependent LLM class oxidoreductase [Actinosynnema pretiosum subsp. pretiosum]|uniref:Luciferase-like monooxygenase n=2 Tax=Actinosynnema TaxID=40566 RepID=C6WFU7_ACTMD|nr:TIGR03564 family F420-dependent LLM class oxidoreductase [Actinosynnema mirum]ACU37883.1 Luciferase-like monooxygenase [Actinosynnema mirum DSM 43827]QUF04572.1 TIGR03564 family F420-dependent LLM class oxidoreductase [Actinosynnema pretiosum subsp. pretiosum]
MRIGTHQAGPPAPGDRPEDLPVDGVWTNQMPGGWDPLALLAAHGPGALELGTAIVPTYPRHPVALATQALTTQALVGGRLTLGIGPSHAWHVTDQLGLPYTSPAAHTREYLEVLRPLLRGEHVRHGGEHFTVDIRLDQPVEPPPVLLSALGPRMLRVARDLADGVVATWCTPELVEGHLAPALGEGARIVVSAVVVLTDDPDAARAQVEESFGAASRMPAYRALLDRGGLAGVGDTAVVGSEEQVLAQLTRLRDAGATDLVLAVLGPPADRARVHEVADELRG